MFSNMKKWLIGKLSYLNEETNLKLRPFGDHPKNYILDGLKKLENHKTRYIDIKKRRYVK